MNINRWGTSLIVTHLTLKHCAHTRERVREYTEAEEQLFLLLRFYTILGWIIYWGIFAGFSPLWFPWGKSLCFLVLLHLSFFQWSFAYGYDVMILNVFRYCITIKNRTWYQIYTERSLCVAETVLQLQLLKIRVSSLKTLKDQN